MPKDVITFSDVDVDRFMVCMRPEIKSLNAKRFTYNIKKENNIIIFNISADDDTAMKAAKSSIEKLHQVYKKMQGISK